jgi:hypothetical protein
LESRGETSSEMGVTFDNHMRHAWLPDPTSSTCKRFGILAAVGLRKWTEGVSFLGTSGTLAQSLQLDNPKKLQHKSQKQKILQSNTRRLQTMLFHNSDILDSGMTMIEANI